MSECKHEDGLCGIAGNPVFSCATCGEKINVPERNALRRVAELETDMADLQSQNIRFMKGLEAVAHGALNPASVARNTLAVIGATRPDGFDYGPSPLAIARELYAAVHEPDWREVDAVRWRLDPTRGGEPAPPSVSDGEAKSWTVGDEPTDLDGLAQNLSNYALMGASENDLRTRARRLLDHLAPRVDYPRVELAREELRWIVSYLAHQDQDANHAWMMQRARSVLSGKDPSTVQGCDEPVAAKVGEEIAFDEKGNG